MVSGICNSINIGTYWRACIYQRWLMKPKGQCIINILVMEERWRERKFIWLLSDLVMQFCDGKVGIGPWL